MQKYCYLKSFEQITGISNQYELPGQVLEEVKDAKYLGFTVSDDLIGVDEAQPEGLSRKVKGNRILLPIVRSFLESVA